MTLREAAEAALTDFIYEHGSDFDRSEWVGFAALEAALAAPVAGEGLDLTTYFPNGLRDADGTCRSCGADKVQQHARRCICLDRRWYTGPEAEPFA